MSSHAPHNRPVLGVQICTNSTNQVAVVPHAGVDHHTLNLCRRAAILSSLVSFFAFGHNGAALLTPVIDDVVTRFLVDGGCVWNIEFLH